jgi:predicted transcriptional regulator
MKGVLMTRRERLPLGPLENAVMQVLWTRKTATADEVRVALKDKQEFKESTIRTILSRLEAKGYLEHDVDGRTFVYRPKMQPTHVATKQVRGIIDRFCRGSVENLLVGMVDENMITPEKLRQLADRIAKAEGEERKGQKVEESKSRKGRK